MGIRQTLYEAIYDTLTAANLLSSTVTVKAAYPDSDTVPFPMVIVNPVDVDKAGYTFDRSHSVKDITIMIDIWTKKNKEKDEISDEIDSVLDGLKIAGAQLVGWTESNAVEPQGGNKVHLKSIILTYMGG